jgi:hypothetical protein
VTPLPTPTTPAPPVPDWLKSRGGSLQPGIEPKTLVVLIGGAPLYKVEARPAAGKFTCAVTNTVNGKRLDDPARTYATPEEALAGGLEQLREKLGW